MSVQLQGTGGTGITYAAVGLPTGLTLNSQTGLIEGTLGVATAGIYVVDVSATIGTSVGSQTFTWIVNPAIRLTAINNQEEKREEKRGHSLREEKRGHSLMFRRLHLK